jgi:hypothetical protein
MASVTASAATRRAASHYYLVHGLRVRSEIDFDAPRARSAGAFDLELKRGEPRVFPARAPDGELLAELPAPGASWLVATGGGYVWRAEDLCEFTVDHALRHARVDHSPALAEEQVSLLIGSFLAKLLALSHRCVLHASAVERGERAIAFIGGSGAGKTTLAAACCAAGAALVSDDVLRVELRAGEGRCFRGSCELRLREAVAQLAEQLPSAERRLTPDGRAGVRPLLTRRTELPIAAFVAPRRRAGTGSLELEPLRGAAALRELLSAPRTLGWLRADQARAELGELAELAERVPVIAATIPAGSLRDAGLGIELLAALDAVGVA